MAKVSAGILGFRRTAVGVEVLVAHPGGPFWAKKDEGAWSIPKGELDDGEAPAAAALREFAEELGIAAPTLHLADLIDLGSVRQSGGKVVHCFGAEFDIDPSAVRSNTTTITWPPRSGTTIEIPEIDRVEWFDPATAVAKLNAAQSEFVARLLDALGT